MTRTLENPTFEAHELDSGNITIAQGDHLLYIQKADRTELADFLDPRCAPIVVGKYPEHASDEDKQALKDALAEVEQGGSIMVSADYSIETHYPPRHDAELMAELVDLVQIKLGSATPGQWLDRAATALTRFESSPK